MLAFDRPDFRRIFFHRIKMDHPVEDDWMEFAAVRIAVFFCGNRPEQTEFRVRSEIFFLAARGSSTEIHMFMPLRDAERNTVVEFVLAEALWRRVHHAD